MQYIGLPATMHRSAGAFAVYPSRDAIPCWGHLAGAVAREHSRAGWSARSPDPRQHAGRARQLAAASCDARLTCCTSPPLFFNPLRHSASWADGGRRGSASRRATEEYSMHFQVVQRRKQARAAPEGATGGSDAVVRITERAHAHSSTAAAVRSVQHRKCETPRSHRRSIGRHRTASGRASC
jgi:hypothetical protein